MKCNGCEIQIPPKWIHCINSNTCPQCGGAIYSDEQKELLEELREALNQMENISAEGVVGWLLSNYNLKKIGSYEPEFHRPPEVAYETRAEGPKTEGPKIAPNIKGFYERANIAKELEGRKNLKAIAQALRDGDFDKQYGSSVDDEGDINVTEEVDISQQEDDSESLLDHPEGPQFLAKELLANNAPMPTNTKPLSPSETEAIMQAINGENSENLPQSINLNRLKKLQKQKELVDMGSVGKIKRR